MIFPSRRSLLPLVPALFTLLALTACDDFGFQPAEPKAEEPPAQNFTVGIDMAPVEPPVPSDEVIPDIDEPMYKVWRPGHWYYENGGFSWVPGELLTRPSPTAVWSQDRWEKRSYGWVFIHGYWE